MLSVILWALGISLAINGVMFLVAFWLKSDKLTDASYAVTFGVLAAMALAHSPRAVYAWIGGGLVWLWALRLGGFLLYRVMRAGRDRRFDGLREHFWQFGKFWLGQAITVWILMLPVMLALSAGGGQSVLVYLGAGVWLAGFLLESTADLQKYRFTHNPAHKNQWIDTGVWRYSRHPNYFGEILVWVGLYLYAWPALSAGGRLIGLSSPLLITVLLLFVSGIPLLEKAADQRWGDNPRYMAYKNRTSLLIPWPPKKN